ncbi:MAG: lipopolysaccharide biosynthesis protein [Vicinamibacteria bacterium]|jgi:O-antigen/teichoic acid export membrane protein
MKAEIPEAEEHEVAAAETRKYGRSAGLLTIALGTAGLLAYAFFAVSSHTLDKHEYGTIVVLWSVNFVVAATLFRPIEQLLSRTLAEHEELGEGSGHVLRIAALIQGGVMLLAVIVMLALRDPITDDLLDGSETLYWVLVVGIAAFGAAYYARGFLAGRRQFGLYATLLVLEGGSRLMFPVAVAVGIAEGVDFVALGVAVAPLASMAVLPFAFASHRRSAPRGEPVDSGLEFTLARGGAFASAVLLMMLSEQILVSSGALFVRGAVDAAAAGFIFNVMMVARAPLLLFQAVAASLLPHLTRLRTRGDATGEDAFRMSINNTVLLIAAFSATVTVGVLLVGPTVMQIAFGDKFTYDRVGLAIVAVGMGFYLSAVALNQAALAQGQARRAAVCWVACAVGFIVFNLVQPLDPYRTVEVGFSVSAAVLSGLLFLLYRRPHPVAADEMAPGSPRELEARLAAVDEIG